MGNWASLYEGGHLQALLLSCRFVYAVLLFWFIFSCLFWICHDQSFSFQQYNLTILMTCINYLSIFFSPSVAGKCFYAWTDYTYLVARGLDRKRWPGPRKYEVCWCLNYKISEYVRCWLCLCDGLVAVNPLWGFPINHTFFLLLIYNFFLFSFLKLFRWSTTRSGWITSLDCGTKSPCFWPGKATIPCKPLWSANTSTNWPCL